jgi:hypothetical protein
MVAQAVVAPAARSGGRFTRREPRPGCGSEREGLSRAGSRGTLTRGLGGPNGETPGRGEYFLPHVRHDPGHARRSRRRSDAGSARLLYARPCHAAGGMISYAWYRFVFAFRARAALMTRGSMRSQARLASLLESGSAVQARMATAPAAMGFSACGTKRARSSRARLHSPLAALSRSVRPRGRAWYTPCLFPR